MIRSESSVYYVQYYAVPYRIRYSVQVKKRADELKLRLMKNQSVMNHPDNLPSKMHSLDAGQDVQSLTKKKRKRKSTYRLSWRQV